MKSKKARTWRTDTGHQLTERELGKLQIRIEGVFEECRDDMAKTAEEYWGKLKVREAKMTKLWNNGEITKEQYASWYRAQVGRGKNFEELRDRMAQRVVEASSYSNDIIRGTLPEMYAINRNWAAYQIESITGADFALWDEHTVKRLLVEKPDLMPSYPIMRAIDNEYNLAYCKTQITNVVTSGIIQGHSIDQMATELVRKVAGMEMHSAVRAARTATTSAENAGRLDSYAEAEGMGIKMEKEWMATLDSRTRHSHAILDGEHVPVKDTFSNGCRYPADPRGAAAEVYNCRCTLTAWFPELKAQNDARYTYSKWKSDKEAEGNTMALRMASPNAFNRLSTSPVAHTSAEKEELKLYARLNGVRLSGMEAFDGDTNLLKSQIDTLASLKAEYGINYPIGIYVDSHLSGGTLGQIGKNHAIRIDRYALRSREITEAYLNSDNYLAASSVEGIIVHEFGHLLEKEYGEVGLETVQKVYYNLYGKAVDMDNAVDFLYSNVSIYASEPVERMNKNDTLEPRDFKEVIPEILSLHSAKPNDFTTAFVDTLKGVYGL